MVSILKIKGNMLGMNGSYLFQSNKSKYDRGVPFYQRGGDPKGGGRVLKLITSICSFIPLPIFHTSISDGVFTS